ncbi:uncharacterized protein LOC144450329 [Glandiceps talaboti]
MMVPVFFFAVFIGCFHGNVAEITIADGSLAIEDLGRVRINANYGTRVTFSLKFMNSLSSTDTVSSYNLDVYLSNDPTLSLKSDKYTISDAAFPIQVEPKNDYGTLVTGLTTTIISSYRNCYFYSYFCAVYDRYRTNGWQCTYIRDNIVCPETEAVALKITNPSPSSINYLTTAYTDITFQIDGYRLYDQASVTGVKLYFTNGNDMNDVNTTYESDEISVVGMTTTDYRTPTYFTLTPLVASPKVDVPNCAHYTHLCAVLVPEAGVSVNNDVCIPLGTNDDQGGTIICPDDGDGESYNESCNCTCSGFSINGNIFILIGASILAMVTAFK